MKYERRDCGIKIRLVPYGAGWTDVYMDFGDGELYFVISNVAGDGFLALLRSLYLLSPNNHEYDAEYDDLMEWKDGYCELEDGKYVVKEILDVPNDRLGTFISIPWKAHFSWNEEGSGSRWALERRPDESTDFMVNVHIEHIDIEDEKRIYDYTVRYDNLCYAVADAYTKAIKKHGFLGYREATYTENVDVRYLLAIKAAALHDEETCKITWYEERGKGTTSDFAAEIELLLFDM